MKPQVFIAPIVEGHGEVQALPVLLRRVAAEANPPVELALNPPLRVKPGSFFHNEDYFRKYVELAARKTRVHARGCVLILLDCEDECPGMLGPEILKRAQNCRSDVQFIVTLAKREYETWFLASARSLRSVCGLERDVLPPDQPESIRDAKGWLSQKMGITYNEPEHQPKMTYRFDFKAAATVHSFHRTISKLREFINQSDPPA